ncbi:hypothetical protein [Pseudomonas frederiksbergensis]|uniref:Uncharacterized protein n=1 Tax=Pseudomonas frederiksbergensis TaxID=104087 RepID=A0A423JYT9_9PSED|nr:hypothetical protein [Pseudomonas frederiksbergensis]RON42917.1 hypothetical protein BK666_22325 [Pseudomonas frederiksbergensis]RON44604.1 hypothetical protein BK667_27465 [Pseudomonas frederiksbergensis]
MEIKDSVSSSDDLVIVFKHPKYGEHTLNLDGKGLLSNEAGYFHINPKYRELDGHSYYMGLKFKIDFEVGKTYTLNKNDDSVTASLQIDHIAGDTHASGTFRLSEGGEFPVGEFKLFEEDVFAVEGRFAFREFKE